MLCRGWLLGNMEYNKDSIVAYATAASESVPSVRYNRKMLDFLCNQMTQVANKLPPVLEYAHQDIISILEDEMKKAATLVKDHARIFNIRNFYKVDLVSNRVNEFCSTFSECCIDLGFEPTASIKSEVDSKFVEEDRRYMNWYLKCIIEGHPGGKQLWGNRGLEMRTLRTEHRSRMRYVKFLKEAEIQTKGRIGEGGYGEVFKAKWGGQDVAVKKLKRRPSLEALAEFYTEVELQVRMDHSNVVRCIGVTALNTMVMELALANLRQLIEWGQDMTWSTKLHLMRSASSGVEHLHHSNLVHRDIKPENFLIFKSLDPSRCTVKIGDFGLAMVKTETRSMTNRPQIGTVLWVAPEIHSGKPHGMKTDVFSFGLVLFEIASGSSPYMGIRTDGQIKKRKKAMKDPCVLPEDCPRGLIVLMRSCINPSYTKRPTMAEVNCQLKQIHNEVGRNCI